MMAGWFTRHLAIALCVSQVRTSEVEHGEISGVDVMRA
jgi:hypothetical protein